VVDQSSEPSASCAPARKVAPDEAGAATNKINHDLATCWRPRIPVRSAGSSDDEHAALALTILNTIDRAARWPATPSNMCATGRCRDRRHDLADLVDEVGAALQEQARQHPNIVRYRERRRQ
jgi:hypothetical protein